MFGKNVSLGVKVLGGFVGMALLIALTGAVGCHFTGRVDKCLKKIAVKAAPTGEKANDLVAYLWGTNRLAEKNEAKKEGDELAEGSSEQINGFVQDLLAVVGGSATAAGRNGKNAHSGNALKRILKSFPSQEDDEDMPMRRERKLFKPSEWGITPGLTLKKYGFYSNFIENRRKRQLFL